MPACRPIPALQLPPCASPECQQRVAAAFALLPAPHPATEALLPRQRTVTGGAATRPPFRPDKEADRAFSRAAASVHLRQQAALNAGAAAGAAGAAAAGGAAGGPGAGRRHVTVQLPSEPGSARPAAHSPGERLVRGLSAVKDSITEGASWFWNGRPNPGGVQWRVARPAMHHPALHDASRACHAEHAVDHGLHK